MLVAWFLLPAQRDLGQHRRNLEKLRSESRQMTERLTLHSELLEAIESEDPRVIRHLAAIEARLIPSGHQPVIMNVNDPRTISERLDDRVPAIGEPDPLPPPSRLDNLVAGPWRFWILAGATFCVFTGLIGSLPTDAGRRVAPARPRPALAVRRRIGATRDLDRLASAPISRTAPLEPVADGDQCEDAVVATDVTLDALPAAEMEPELACDVEAEVEPVAGPRVELPLALDVLNGTWVHVSAAHDPAPEPRPNEGPMLFDLAGAPTDVVVLDLAHDPEPPVNSESPAVVDEEDFLFDDDCEVAIALAALDAEPAPADIEDVTAAVNDEPIDTVFVDDETVVSAEGLAAEPSAAEVGSDPVAEEADASETAILLPEETTPELDDAAAAAIDVEIAGEHDDVACEIEVPVDDSAVAGEGIAGSGPEDLHGTVLAEPEDTLLSGVPDDEPAGLAAGETECISEMEAEDAEDVEVDDEFAGAVDSEVSDDVEAEDELAGAVESEEPVDVEVEDELAGAVDSEEPVDVEVEDQLAGAVESEEPGNVEAEDEFAGAVDSEESGNVEAEDEFAGAVESEEPHDAEAVEDDALEAEVDDQAAADEYEYVDEDDVEEDEEVVYVDEDGNEIPADELEDSDDEEYECVDEDDVEEDEEVVYVDENGKEIPADELEGSDDDEYEYVDEEESEEEEEVVYVDEDGNEIPADEIEESEDDLEAGDEYEYVDEEELKEDEEVVYVDEDGNEIPAEEVEEWEVVDEDDAAEPVADGA